MTNDIIEINGIVSFDTIEINGLLSGSVPVSGKLLSNPSPPSSDSAGWTVEQIKLLQLILENVMWINDNNGEGWSGTVVKLISSLLSSQYDPEAPDETGVMELLTAPYDIDENGVLTLE